MTEATRLRNLATSLRVLDPRDVFGAERPGARQIVCHAADELEQMAARVDAIDERSFNAGFDAVGLSMQRADPRNFSGFHTTHPQWMADRAEAFRKAQGFTS